MQPFYFDNGDGMPAFGLGTWKSGPGEVRKAVRDAIDMGYRHIDCAHVYGNETEVGQGLRDAMADGVQRKQLWVTSKLWNTSHRPEDVEPALRDTLARLQLDQLDLYLMHWPVALKPGTQLPKTASDMFSPDELPFTETWAAMEACAQTGLVRHIGVSNFSTPKLQRLLETARIKPAMEQVELHPYLQQDKLLAFCKQHGIPVTAYSPLGSADRPKAMKTEGEPILLQDPLIHTVAERHQASPAQVLLAWALARGTAVIPKSVNRARIRENLEATRLQLSAADMNQIAGLDRHRRYVTGEEWAVPGSGYTLANLWDE